MAFNRLALPDPVEYYTETAGLVLTGPPRAKVKTTSCEFHGGSDSMRVWIDTGGFVCMAGCGAKGGDVLDYHRAKNGMGFVDAAKALGAWIEDGKPHIGSTRPTRVPAKDLLQLAADELTVGAMVMADALNGHLNDADFDRFCDATARVIHVAEVANGLR
jgi:hypothetical protein